MKKVISDDLRRLLNEFVGEYTNITGEKNKRRGPLRGPLLVTATLDERFEKLPHIASPDHTQFLS